MSTWAGVAAETLPGESGGLARLRLDGRVLDFPGRWVGGGPWERFGLYNSYVVVRGDGAVLKIPGHAGELVPGSTEDLEAALRRYDPERGYPPAPMTVELDSTYACASKDCGGRCFSAPYRSLAPAATIPTESLREIIEEFAEQGGSILRFDGGGDPLVHPAVRSGELPELAGRLGLKTTILTAGDLFGRTDLERIGAAGCYVRISLNAATDETRMRFHGNRVSLVHILGHIERFAGWIERSGLDLPIGATFLLDTLNYREVLDCARLSRAAGIAHFSVRRVLGPPAMRPSFTPAQLGEAEELLAEVRAFGDHEFRVFVPWRHLHEEDPEPACFEVARCWQSTFKTILEPDPGNGGFKSQLCGRYRGDGVGQAMQLAPLFSATSGTGWAARWRASFRDYPLAREALPGHCVSCIDRGFILCVDRLVRFLRLREDDFRIFHLASTEPDRVESWPLD